MGSIQTKQRHYLRKAISENEISGVEEDTTA